MSNCCHFLLLLFFFPDHRILCIIYTCTPRVILSWNINCLSYSCGVMSIQFLHMNMIGDARQCCHSSYNSNDSGATKGMNSSTPVANFCQSSERHSAKLRSLPFHLHQSPPTRINPPHTRRYFPLFACGFVIRQGKVCPTAHRPNDRLLLTPAVRNT